jgi:beta-galactosidase
MITVEVQDAQGRTVPTADDQLAFQVAGPGRLIGLGNGCPTSHEPDKGTTRKAFMGLAQAIVQSLFQPGTITVHATAPGLQSATIEIASDSVERARAQ